MTPRARLSSFLDRSPIGSDAVPATRFMLVDDHRLFGEGLRALVSREPHLDLVAVAHDADEARALAVARDCDVVVVDVSLPGVAGPMLARELKAAMPSLHILMLSMHDEAEIVAQCFDCGADGYALKSQSPRELFEAIRAVAAGERYVAPLLLRRGAPHGGLVH